MDDSSPMELIDSSADLLHDAGNLSLGEGFASLELMKELSSDGHLHNEIDVFLIVEAAIELDDVRVV